MKKIALSKKSKIGLGISILFIALCFGIILMIKGLKDTSGPDSSSNHINTTTVLSQMSNAASKNDSGSGSSADSLFSYLSIPSILSASSSRKESSAAITPISSMPAVTSIPETDSPVLPNIVIILMDDLGWKDLGCYGSTYYQTPNIDKMASEGMSFTNAYAAAPVCSPTRSSILTGVSPSTLRQIGAIGDTETRNRALIEATYNPLPGDPEEVRENSSISTDFDSFANVLKLKNYITIYTGKWHSGLRGPDKMGFDLRSSDYFAAWSDTRASAGNADGGITKKVIQEAVEYIKTFSNLERPFLLYINHFTVHVPYQADASTIEYFGDPANAVPDIYQKNATYAAMVKEMDNSVGSIMKAIKDNKIDKNTMVIFTSDNGGLTGVINPKTGKFETATSQYPLRGGKATLYEGGIRVPFIVRYPGVVPVNKKTAAMTSSMDIYPTLADFTGGEKPSYLEGLSFKDVLTGKNDKLGRDTLYFHYPQYKASLEPVSAVRKGNYKMLYFWETKKYELYDLSKDISESADISASDPSKVDEMRNLLQAYLTRTNAPVPMERK